jgi:hypothetical protein
MRFRDLAWPDCGAVLLAFYCGMICGWSVLPALAQWALAFVGCYVATSIVCRSRLRRERGL